MGTLLLVTKLSKVTVVELNCHILVSGQKKTTIRFYQDEKYSHVCFHDFWP